MDVLRWLNLEARCNIMVVLSYLGEILPGLSSEFCQSYEPNFVMESLSWIHMVLTVELRFLQLHVVLPFYYCCYGNVRVLKLLVTMIIHVACTLSNQKSTDGTNPQSWWGCVRGKSCTSNLLWTWVVAYVQQYLMSRTGITIATDKVVSGMPEPLIVGSCAPGGGHFWVC